MTRGLTIAIFACAFVVPDIAHAGRCDWLVHRVATVSGADLVQTYKNLAKCDKAEAEIAFDAFMRASGDVQTLSDLTLAAIGIEVYTPVWQMMDKIPYDVRDDVAKDVGSACDEHQNIVAFLQGAYFGLRAPQFSPWSPALSRCKRPDFKVWIEGLATEPPTHAYDEKYNAILSAYVKLAGIDALPVLQETALKAAENGPFGAIIEKMDEAAQPAGFGKKMSDAERQRLEEALTDVARQVSPEQAAQVADRLYNAGSEPAAVSLLPIIYKDKISGNGRLTYGAASVESCDQQATVHWSAVSEPATRWGILEDVREPTRAFKPRLKCNGDEEWPVMTTNGPVANKTEIQQWVQTLVDAWTEKGFEVKSREEKPISLD